MRRTCITSKILAKLYRFYIELVYHTCRITLNKTLNDGSFVVGFWHGDSFAMYPLLKKLKKYDGYIITTADMRGDYITNIVESFDLIPVRLTDDDHKGRFFSNLREIINSDRNLYATLDGPLGPRHIPKELVLRLAYLSKKEFISIKVRYSKVIRIKNRWDKYGIPLPFTKIEYTINEPIPIKKSDFREFYKLGDRIRSELND